jgi:hypothetical protein
MNAVRHYFQVFDQVRATGDATLINSVTDPDGVDRSNTQAYVLDQQSKHVLSVITKDVFSNWKVQPGAPDTIVYFDYQLTGYNIDPQSRTPLESPTTLPPEHQMMKLRIHGQLWLVFERRVLPSHG